MDNSPFILNVLGLQISFKTGVNLERARQAAQLLEERYAEQQNRPSGGQGKESVMKTILAFRLADELLQTKNELEALRNGLASTLEKIKKSL
ncbi:MAG: cell division protein ZapA [Desulfovibrio sp.]|nr:cell division protein ZapA [Desulfovibrio sp.]